MIDLDDREIYDLINAEMADWASNLIAALLKAPDVRALIAERRARFESIRAQIFACGLLKRSSSSRRPDFPFGVSSPRRT